MSNITSIVVTHNARLRCLITKLFNKSAINNDISKREQFKEYRWQNCCVLKLILVPTNNQYNFNLSLTYNGQIDPKEKKAYHYWSDREYSENLAPKSKGCIGALCSKKNEPLPQRVFHIFEALTGSINLGELSDLNAPEQTQLDNTTFTFYLVRHGQAEHNLYTSTTVFRKTDTSLTENGINSAYEAGIEINNDLQKNNSILRYYFASDLIRTRQTLQGILRNIQTQYLHIDRIGITYIINLVILPCSHELSFVSNGNCDSAVNMGQPFTSENKMSCTNLSQYQNNSAQFKDCANFTITNADNKNIVVRLNWNMYSDFYGKSYRGSNSKTRKHCRETSMIGESIKYILTNNSATTQKAGRRRRKSRKLKRKTRRHKK